jgi:hypothetical protein
MKKTLLNSLFCLVLVSSLFAASGCGLLSRSDTSSEVISFIKGELFSKIDQDLKSVYNASKKVATESQFVSKSDRIDAFSAVLKYEDAQQRKVDITLENEAPEVTRIKIRVGLLGDAELSTKLFEQIKSESNK